MTEPLTWADQLGFCGALVVIGLAAWWGCFKAFTIPSTKSKGLKAANRKFGDA